MATRDQDPVSPTPTKTASVADANSLKERPVSDTVGNFHYIDQDAVRSASWKVDLLIVPLVGMYCTSSLLRLASIL